MKQSIKQLPSFKITGLGTRTSYNNELNPTTAKIGNLWGRFLAGQPSPGTIISFYSDYETDETGFYDVTLGVEVALGAPTGDGLVSKTAPESKYAVFTTEPGPMPQVVIQAWQYIWSLTPEQLGGTRTYTGDFEVHDERSRDPLNAQVDIYVAIK